MKIRQSLRESVDGYIWEFHWRMLDRRKRYAVSFKSPYAPGTKPTSATSKGSQPTYFGNQIGVGARQSSMHRPRDER